MNASDIRRSARLNNLAIALSPLVLGLAAFLAFVK
jgi:hypothetical protein